MSLAWRWITGPDVAAEPALNMAIDQAIFEAHVAGMAPPTIRVYPWGAPALTIGRLQSAEAARAAFLGVPCIRRPTGGRAVLHGSDLTISIAVREDHLADSRGVLPSYKWLIRAVSETLAGYGAELARGQDRRRDSRSQDCFDIVAKCDLVDRSSGRKALGAAQLRQKGTILQQMSLRPLQNVEILGAEFQSKLRHNFQEALNIRQWCLENELTNDEHVRARQIIEETETNARAVGHTPANYLTKERSIDGP